MHEDMVASTDPGHPEAERLHEANDILEAEIARTSARGFECALGTHGQTSPVGMDSQGPNRAEHQRRPAPEPNLSHDQGGGMMTTVTSRHVRLDARGVAWIDDTNVKVTEVVLDRMANGWSPEQIHFQHPDLSLAQIHSALAHYFDHQAQLDTEISQQSEHVRRVREQAGESPLAIGLKARGLLR